MGRVGNRRIDQELLPDDAPQAAAFRQLLYKPSCQLSRASIRIRGIGIIKADVNAHG
jgi:hypothetical protein